MHTKSLLAIDSGYNFCITSSLVKTHLDMVL